jgi:hypothetical protein
VTKQCTLGIRERLSDSKIIFVISSRLQASQKYCIFMPSQNAFTEVCTLKLARGVYFTQHCFVCRPADSDVSEDAGIEPKAVCVEALIMSGYESEAVIVP